MPIPEGPVVVPAWSYGPETTNNMAHFLEPNSIAALSQDPQGMAQDLDFL